MAWQQQSNNNNNSSNNNSCYYYTCSIKLTMTKVNNENVHSQKCTDGKEVTKKQTHNTTHKNEEIILSFVSCKNSIKVMLNNYNYHHHSLCSCSYYYYHCYFPLVFNEASSDKSQLIKIVGPRLFQAVLPCWCMHWYNGALPLVDTMASCDKLYTCCLLYTSPSPRD